MAGLPAIQRIRKGVRQLVESVIDEHLKTIRAELAERLEGELQGIIETGLGLTSPATGKQSELRLEAKRLAGSLGRPRKSKAATKKAAKKKVTKKAAKKKVTKKAAATKTTKKVAAKSKKAGKKKVATKKASGKKKASAKKTGGKKGSAGFEELKAKLKAKRRNGTEQTCGVSGCTKPVRSMGYCASDYQNARNNEWPMPCPEKFDAPKRARGRPKTDGNGATAQVTA
jgi:hypothetical protein